MQSATLERAVMISGQGLFTGEPCRAEVRPADCGLAFIKKNGAHPAAHLKSEVGLGRFNGSGIIELGEALCLLTPEDHRAYP